MESRHGGTLGVAALDTADRRFLPHRGNEPFAMCSTFKLLLVAAVADRADRKVVNWDKQIRYDMADLLEWAPVTSNPENPATGEMTRSTGVRPRQNSLEFPSFVGEPPGLARRQTHDRITPANPGWFPHAAR